MNKELWLIWKEPTTRRRYKVGILKNEEKEFTFEYSNPELDEAKKVGFNYFPGFNDTSKKYKSTALFSNISTRLLNKKRPDYLELLNRYNLENDSSEFEILTATRGRLITDSYEFVRPFNNNKIEFDIAGTRYSKDLKYCKKLLEINDKLFFELEENNKYDDNAIKVILEKNNKKFEIGYVPRYYSKQLSKLLKENIKYSALIKNINFETEFNDEDITASVKLIFNL